jgi:hypothetical protein
MKLFQLLSLMLCAVAAVDAFYDYVSFIVGHNDWGWTNSAMEILTDICSAIYLLPTHHQHNDPAKKEHLDDLRSRLPNLQTGSHLNGKNIVNKQRGADSRVLRADDMLTLIQKDEAGTAQHGINQLLKTARSLYNAYDDEDEL